MNNRQHYFYAEGNNGGDYIKISNVKDNMVLLEVGNCCVHTIMHYVPVEFVTLVLTNAVIEHGSIEKVIEASNWPIDFKQNLIDRVHNSREIERLKWKIADWIKGA